MGECKSITGAPWHAEEFAGIKEIPIGLVKIDVHKTQPPNHEKVLKLIEYYKDNGRLDKPIVVSPQGDKYLLEDKYLRYYVATQLGLETIPAKIGTLKESKAEDLLRKVGTPVIHQRYGKGSVIEASSTKTTIRFKSGEIITFDISRCAKTKLFTFR